MASARESLSVCITTHNNEETIAACIRACQGAAGGLDLELIVCDNASADRTVAVIVDFGTAVRLLAAETNLGFGAGCNRALAAARGEWILFLNPDTEPQAGSFAVMIAYLKAHPEAGMAGCALVTPDGKHQRSVRGFPTFAGSLHGVFPFAFLPHCRRAYAAYRMRGFDYGRSGEAPCLMGAAMLAHRDVLRKVGGFDRRFFMYFEDVDLSMSIRDLGLESAYVAEARILHRGGHSAHQSRRLVLCERQRSMMLYFAKHEGRGRTRRFKLLYLPMLMLTFLLQVPLDLLHAAKYFLRGDSYRRRRKLEHARTKALFVVWDWLKVARA